MPQSQNKLLASLPADVLENLKSQLKPMELVHGRVLYNAGDTLDRVYFPCTGAISLVVAMQDGQMIESAMVGRDSIVGASAALDGRIALFKAIVQMPGSAFTLGVEALRTVARESEAFRTTLIRHDQVIFAQAQQSAGYNAVHSIDQRLARWLLRTRDLSGNEVLPLTQEFLSEMLGVRRTSVSMAAKSLQDKKLLAYSRGSIKIVDLKGLQECACECYESVKQHYTRLLSNSN